MKEKTDSQRVKQPRLKIIKTLWRNKLIKTSFVVIDLNGHEYPQNFVCIFPKNWFKKSQKSNLYRSKFSHIFGKQTHEVARTLLEDALKRETHAGVKAEIQARLREVRESERQEMAANGWNRVQYPGRKDMFDAIMRARSE